MVVLVSTALGAKSPGTVVLTVKSYIGNTTVLSCLGGVHTGRNVGLLQCGIYCASFWLSLLPLRSCNGPTDLDL